MTRARRSGRPRRARLGRPDAIETLLDDARRLQALFEHCAAAADRDGLADEARVFGEAARTLDELERAGDREGLRAFLAGVAGAAPSAAGGRP